MLTQQADTQASLTPADALQLLVDGNERFKAHRRADRNLLEQVEKTSGGQWPFAAVLGCIDSRASTELVFDQGIGDVFSIRVAGNFVNDDILGCMEFACKVAGSKLVVVVGHTHCGAIKGAVDSVRLGNLTHLIEKLEPAAKSVEDAGGAGERSSANPDFVQRTAESNVHRTIAEIRQRSPLLAEMEEKQEIGIVGAMYDVQTGGVQFYASDSPALSK